MTDDLVKRLRDLGDHASFEPHMHHTAADRIEELEAKLAKVITAYRIEAMRRDNYSHAAFQQHLAELTGGKDE